MSAEKKAHYRKKLTEARNELMSFLNSLSDEQFNSPVFSDEQTWSVRDVLSHLAENERGMSIHIYKIKNGRETVPEEFDVNEWNAGVKERMGTPTREELLKTLEETRAKTLEGLESLGDDEWQLKGRHPVQGVITIEEYYNTIANHDLHHLNDIKTGLGI